MLETNKYPSISVIIPSFNQGQYIEETLVSVIGQQYPNLEVIVIDGGSTDNTVEIIEKYSSQITYWHSKKDKGQADAINQGMNLSTGEVLCWLNSDDMYLPGTLLDVGKKFAGRTDENYLIYGAAINIREGDRNLYSYTQPTTPFDKFTLTYLDFMAQPSAFWTRKLWESTGEINANYHYVIDWDWFIRASRIVDFKSVQKFYSICRQHPFHKTSNGGSQRREEIREVVSKYSSEFWQELYVEVEKSYPNISKFITEARIPKKNLLLPILFPGVASKIKKPQDLYTVLTMYG